MNNPVYVRTMYVGLPKNSGNLTIKNYRNS
jgi:hypothetical protein